MTTSTVVRVGDSPRTKPKATPASETWLSVSLIRLCRRKIRKVPRIGEKRLMAITAKKARCIKS